MKRPEVGAIRALARATAARGAQLVEAGEQVPQGRGDGQERVGGRGGQGDHLEAREGFVVGPLGDLARRLREGGDAGVQDVDFFSEVHGRTVLVQLPDEEDPESYTWVDKLCDDLLDIVLDKAPRWFLIGCGVVVVVGLPAWIAESLS